MKIKKGDNVIVIAGPHKGKKGPVVKTITEEERVIVEGVNIHKKHQRPRRQGEQGQIVERAMPIHVSNVMIIDSKTGKQSRIGYKMEDGKKVRISKKSGQKI